MSGLNVDDVEALLEIDTPAKPKTPVKDPVDHHDRLKSDRNNQRERDLARDGSRDRDKDRKRSNHNREDSDNTDKSSIAGSLKTSRRRSGSLDRGRRDSRRHRLREPADLENTYRPSAGDHYQGSGRPRTRSRSLGRYYRPGHDGRHSREYERNKSRERDSNRHGADGRGRRSNSPDGDKRREPRGSKDEQYRPSPKADPHKRGRSRTKSPQLTEDERDKRTVFVQQLAARLSTKQLREFFSNVGEVKDAQIVKDRISQRSKGVGYVEFREEVSVSAALELTGQKLLGIPIIVQLTEAEKNRQARAAEGTSSANAGVPFHRLYVGNIHFSITEPDLQTIFEPFGTLEFVQLQKEEGGRSKGYGFVQFSDPNQAKAALEQMNGFEIAGRPIRVGLGNDKFTNESTANLLRSFGPNGQQYQGSAFSGAGGRGAHAGGSANFDRVGGRDNDKNAGGASALDDTDVAGVNFNNFNRNDLMRKLARTDEPAKANGGDKKMVQPKPQAKPIPATVYQPSRCVRLHNMFDAKLEHGNAWMKELEDDVKQECDEKYGRVVHISLQPNTEGDIYVKFDRIAGGENAMKGLNGRFFGGRTITASPVSDAIYDTVVTSGKAR